MKDLKTVQTQIKEIDNLILSKDLRIKKNQIIIQEALRKVKPFKNISLKENILIEMLEKLISVLNKTYTYQINTIRLEHDGMSTEAVYCWSVVIKQEEQDYFVKLYDCTIYGLMCKLALLMYNIKGKKRGGNKED